MTHLNELGFDIFWYIIGMSICVPWVTTESNLNYWVIGGFIWT